MSALQNIDLLSVSLVVAAIGVLGFTIFFNNSKSITNKTFLYLAIFISLWSVLNYASYKVFEPGQIIWILRGVVFSATWFAFFIFKFFYVFPKEKSSFPRWYRYILIPVVLMVSFLTLTSLMFSQIAVLSSSGGALQVINGPAIFAFGLLIFFLDGGAFVLLFIKIIKGKREERRPYITILYGVLITLSLIITFNFIFPAFLNNTVYIPYGAFFVFPFVAFTAYATYRNKLFNIRNFAYGVLAFFIPLILAVEFVFVNSIGLLIIIGAAFVISLIIGIEFIKNLYKLQIFNEGQQQFIHYLNHESKGYLTDDNVVLAAVRDQDFGPTSPELQKMATTVLRKNARAVDDINEMILGADLGSGAVRYTMEAFDLAAEVRTFVDEYRPDAEEKQQKLEFRLEPADGDFTVVADKRRLIRHALKNYLKNAIVYTPVGGTITVMLSRKAGEKGGTGGDKVMLAVQDSGVGITAEDKARLFTEGGKGMHSTDVNPNSTGRGLYIVKQIIEAHHGRVWADSLGAGKGSTFALEVPVGQK